MKPHKIYQRYYNSLNIHDDQLSTIPYIIEENPQTIVQRVVEYFTIPTDLVSYPAKSYAVALIYAHQLRENFNEDFMSSIDDPDLLCGNDRYFKTYTQASHIYEMIFEQMNFKSNSFELPSHLPQVEKTLNYFMLEFNLA